jgi:hypothetical protein
VIGGNVNGFPASDGADAGLAGAVNRLYLDYHGRGTDQDCYPGRSNQERIDGNADFARGSEYPPRQHPASQIDRNYDDPAVAYGSTTACPYDRTHIDHAPCTANSDPAPAYYRRLLYPTVFLAG